MIPLCAHKDCLRQAIWAPHLSIPIKDLDTPMTAILNNIAVCDEHRNAFTALGLLNIIIPGSDTTMRAQLAYVASQYKRVPLFEEAEVVFWPIDETGLGVKPPLM